MNPFSDPDIEQIGKAIRYKTQAQIMEFITQFELHLNVTKKKGKINFYSDSVSSRIFEIPKNFAAFDSKRAGSIGMDLGVFVGMVKHHPTVLLDAKYVQKIMIVVDAIHLHDWFTEYMEEIMAGWDEVIRESFVKLPDYQKEVYMKYRKELSLR